MQDRTTVYRDIFMASPQAMAIFDADGRLVETNAAFKALLETR
ncbi:PAS domain S-box protein, partial [Pararhodobacter marinus]